MQIGARRCFSFIELMAINLAVLTLRQHCVATGHSPGGICKRVTPCVEASLRDCGDHKRICLLISDVEVRPYPRHEIDGVLGGMMGGSRILPLDRGEASVD
jgi:hypothetical protein